jgi:hypothetical protein
MTYDREKWIAKAGHPNEAPTPEKEEAAWNALVAICSDPEVRATGVDAIRTRAYRDSGVWLAHAHWVADCIQSRGGSVKRGGSRWEALHSDPHKLKSCIYGWEYESYRPRD